MKKILLILLMFYIIPIANASTVPLVKIGDRLYDTLQEAVDAASNDEVITLVSDIKLGDTLNINKVVNINLNGNDIVASEKVFQIKGGYLTLSGKGTIKESRPNYGAIMLVGSSSPINDKYSGVDVGADVTLEGWSGIFINHENSKSYGVYVNLKGNINAVDDISGATGIGIYVNGKIQDRDIHPVVNIMDGSNITSTGNGIYMAGYSTFYIGDAYIEGVESAIGIKSGNLVIDGATVICNGGDKTPSEGYSNGIKASGTTIQIESNSGYSGHIEVDISNGDFISKNSNVIYEYVGAGNNSKIYSISISGGKFTSGAGKNVFLFSESFKNIHSGFISGGEYSTEPSDYLKSGYEVIKKDGRYNVIKNTFKQVSSDSIKTTNSNAFIMVLIFGLTLIAFVLFKYFNKNNKI